MEHRALEFKVKSPRWRGCHPWEKSAVELFDQTGQKCRAIGREVMRSLLALIKQLFAQGKSCEELLEMLMPA